jgi:hypothetical protein
MANLRMSPSRPERTRHEAECRTLVSQARRGKCQIIFFSVPVQARESITLRSAQRTRLLEQPKQLVGFGQIINKLGRMDNKDAISLHFPFSPQLCPQRIRSVLMPKA